MSEVIENNLKTIERRRNEYGVVFVIPEWQLRQMFPNGLLIYVYCPADHRKVVAVLTRESLHRKWKIQKPAPNGLVFGQTKVINQGDCLVIRDTRVSPRVHKPMDIAWSQPQKGVESHWPEVLPTIEQEEVEAMSRQPLQYVGLSTDGETFDVSLKNLTRNDLSKIHNAIITDAFAEKAITGRDDGILSLISKAFNRFL